MSVDVQKKKGSRKKRDMFWGIQFVFFDFEEPLIFFLLDYVAAMGLFVFVGHCFAELLKCCSRKRKRV